MDDVRCTLTNGDTVGSTEEQLVFAYGALRSPHVLAAILRRIPKSERCTLVNDWVREVSRGKLVSSNTWVRYTFGNHGIPALAKASSFPSVPDAPEAAEVSDKE